MKNHDQPSKVISVAEWVRAYIDALVSPQGPSNASAAVAYARAVACCEARNVRTEPPVRRPVACACR